MVDVGEMAPDFTLIADDGHEVRLSDLRGRKVVLYFYPKADTPGCTRQACAVRDAYAALHDRGVQVIGISPDPPERLARFRRKHQLPFPLLSDPDHRVAEMYGVWGEKRRFGKTYMGIIRSHFLIDEGGRLLVAEREVKPESTAELALRVAQEAEE